MNTNFLDEFVDKSLQRREPTDCEVAQYLFWKHGIGFKEFNNTPISYIISMLYVHDWVQTKEKEKIDEIKNQKVK